MKRIFPAKSSALSCIALLAALVLPAHSSRATTELDRLYALETIGFIPSWDNVDGLFQDYAAAAYREYFSRQSRFVLQDLSKAGDALTKSKIPYYKVIDDKEILGQLARSTRTQSLIRTKVMKEGRKYRFTLDWLHSPNMDTMASETFELDEPADGQALGMGNVKGEIEKGLDRMIAKLPFQGQVTGRDNNSVTINLGSSANLKPGDTVQIATLDQVKKHPLLGEIVEWRLTPTGKIQLESVDEKLSFGKVLEEEEGKRIARYQKITQILPKPVPSEIPITNDQKEREQDLMQPPSLGYLRAGAGLGGFSRSYSQTVVSTNVSNTRTSGDFLTEIEAEGEIWLNREWFVDLGLRFGFFGYTQTPGTVTGQSGDVTQFQASFGYTYLVTPDFFGPKAWVKAGYRSNAYGLPAIPVELVGSTTFGSLLVGLGGELPIRDNWGGTANVDFGILPSATEVNKVTGSGAGMSVTDVSFFLGGFYRFSPRMTFRAGIDVVAHSATFQATNLNSSLSQKTITFAPSLLYYF